MCRGFHKGGHPYVRWFPPAGRPSAEQRGESRRRRAQALVASERTRSLHDWAEPLLGGEWGMEDEESGLGGGRGGAHYRTLGVSHTATEAELKKAYRTLALRYHPDKNPDAGDRCGFQRCVSPAGQPSSTRPPSLGRFREISVAYAVVSDPEKRLIYDRYGDQSARQSWPDS